MITYKDCEAAFDGVPGAWTAHFNAVAGLDCWKDVALLIVIGRPLPPDGDASRIAGVMFDETIEGEYRRARKGVMMRGGQTMSVQAIEHAHPSAEIVRAAISDDELIQAIGRGRGVNRNAETPLEVHLLADAALPILHDRLSVWDAVEPDLFQRMLLRSVATSSPADAALLHPDLFTGDNQAKKQFQARLFKGQNPMNSTYRGMTLKSARYRLPGRGRGWTHVWWLDGDANRARDTLTAALGALASFEPCDN